MSSEPMRLKILPNLKGPPAVLGLLTVLAVVFFLAVNALTRVHDSQLESLAERWASRGVANLNAKNYPPAVEDFRTALVYSRNNAAYRLSLAQALMGLHRDGEAQAYLINLWQEEPESGLVSLELARIAVNRNDAAQALRYYHNAIYGTWNANPDIKRRKTRLELIAYLMRIGANPQAEAELIDLAATVGNNAAQQQQLGQMFAEVGDDRRALAAFRASLRREHRNAAALAGAGDAAYRLGQYEEARRYLEDALAIAPHNAETAQSLKKTEEILQWDPFRRGINPVEQNRMVLAAFAAAGARLKSCKPPNAQQQQFQQQWSKMRRKMTWHNLVNDPDLASAAMNLVFAIETQTAGACGPPTEADEGLLLAASLQEGN